VKNQIRHFIVPSLLPSTGVVCNVEDFTWVTLQQGMDAVGKKDEAGGQKCIWYMVRTRRLTTRKKKTKEGDVTAF